MNLMNGFKKIKNIATNTTLKPKCDIATTIVGLGDTLNVQSVNASKKGMNSNTPKVLIKVFETANFLAVWPMLRETNNAVNVVPIFAPKTIGTESAGCSNPCCTKMMVNPVTTVLDCMMMVSTIPIRMLTNLLEVCNNNSFKCSDSLKGAIDELTKSRLKKINPKKKIPFPNTFIL